MLKQRLMSKGSQTCSRGENAGLSRLSMGMRNTLFALHLTQDVLRKASRHVLATICIAKMSCTSSQK